MNNKDLRFEEVKVGHSYLAELKNGKNIVVNNVAMVDKDNCYYFYQAYDLDILRQDLVDMLGLQDVNDVDLSELVHHENLNLIMTKDENDSYVNPYDGWIVHERDNYFHIEDVDFLVSVLNKDEVVYLLDTTETTNTNDYNCSLVS